MIYKILSSTDNKYLGHEIDISEDKILILDNMLLSFNYKISLGENHYRFENSNYIIDVEKLL